MGGRRHENGNYCGRLGAVRVIAQQALEGFQRDVVIARHVVGLTQPVLRVVGVLAVRIDLQEFQEPFRCSRITLGLQVVEGGVPGQEVTLPLQIANQRESRAVAQLASPGQVQRVINQLCAPGQGRSSQVTGQRLG